MLLAQVLQIWCNSNTRICRGRNIVCREDGQTRTPRHFRPSRKRRELDLVHPLEATVPDALASSLSGGERDGHRERLRTRFAAHDPSFDELSAIELLLTFSIPRVDVRPAAALLLEKFGNLDGVLSAAPEELSGLTGIKEASVTLLKLVDCLSKRRGASSLPLSVVQTEEKSVDTAPAPSRSFQTLLPVPEAQVEMFLDGPARANESGKSSPKKVIQDALLTEGLLAVKLAGECQTLEQLQEELLKKLGQNSMETRRRYAQSILRWFFRDGIDGILRRVWMTYQDDAILADLLRWSFLEQEEVMGASVAQALFPLENGIAIPTIYFEKFLSDFLGEAPPEKTRERLKSNLKRLGFLERAQGKPDRLMPVVPQKTSLLILLHHLFASKSLRTVELRILFANPFWKYLGYKSEDTVRNVLREADAAGVIGKYIVADQLEQVTTCFTLTELLERRVRI